MIRPLLIAATLAFAVSACSRPGTEHGHAESNMHEEVAKGPHGGRLLVDGDFAVEVTIFERGVPPEFRVYPRFGNAALVPAEVQLTMELKRLNGLPGGKIDRHVFAAKDDYLLSAAEVYEPHSFAVQLQARYAGKTYTWHYDAPEARVEIDADMAAAMQLTTATVDGGVLHESLALYGSIVPNAERVRAVSARFAGIVREVAVQPGDIVKAGQTLARVESNESLQVYAITAPIAGTVVARHTNPGESATDSPLFELADFSSVWAELSVFPRDRAQLKPGQSVQLSATDGGATGSGVIAYISPLGSGGQTLLARVVLDNTAGLWTPGQFVNARVTVGESGAARLVPLAALQRLRDWDVVFVADGTRYQAQPVTLGRRDATQVEIVDGLADGARIVVGNSYLVKADIEKSGASHDH